MAIAEITHPAGLHEHRRRLARLLALAARSLGVAPVGELHAGLLIDAMAVAATTLDGASHALSSLLRLEGITDENELAGFLSLLGIHPRPGVGAAAVAALIAAEALPGPPLGGRIAIAGQAANERQVFESTAIEAVAAIRNVWSVGRVEEIHGGPILLEASTTRLVAGAIAAFWWNLVTSTTERGADGTAVVGNDVASSIPMGLGLARRVDGIRPILDILDEPLVTPTLDIGLPPAVPPPSEARIFMPSLRAQLTRNKLLDPFDSEVDSATTPIVNFAIEIGQATGIHLDALYREIGVGDLVVVSKLDEALVGVVLLTEERRVEIAAGLSAPVTALAVVPPVPDAWKESASAIAVHYHMVDAGTPIRPAKTELTLDDLAAPGGVPLLPPLRPLPAELLPDEVIVEDADGRGALLRGRIEISSDQDGRFIADQDQPLPHPLRAPVKLYGNVVHATRGETVPREVLGSGDPRERWQGFTLARKPLTYLADASAPEHRRSTLEVFVDGVRWREVRSFYGQAPTEEVYVVRLDGEGAATVTFGDGVRGRRLPSGVDNVVATYRFGAGAARPPAGALTQIVRQVPGVRRVIHPVPAWGGADAQSAAELRRNGPRSALTLGRAVSIADFEAIALDLGVKNARADWAWDERSQTALVKVWIISDGASVAAEVAASLRHEAGPEVRLVVGEATPRPTAIDLELDVDPRFLHTRVVDDVLAALAVRGPLALENVPIGRPIFRSRLFEVVQGVAGVAGIAAVSVDGAAPGLVLPAAEGEYLAALEQLRVDGRRFTGGA